MVIYGPHSLEPFESLGLNYKKATNLAFKLHTHLVQYAYKLVSSRRALEETFATSHHQGQEYSSCPSRALLVTLLILIDFFILFFVGRVTRCLDHGLGPR